jgi:hypothetical protein
MSSPAFQVQAARLTRTVRVSGCSGPSTRSRAEAAPQVGRGPRPRPRLPGPAGEVVADSQGVRVLRARDPLVNGQQRGELVAGPGRIPRHPGPAGEVAAGGQGVHVVGGRRRHPLCGRRQSNGKVPGRRVVAAKAEVSRDPMQTAAGQGQGRPGVRQQRSARRPGRGQFGVGGGLWRRSGARRAAPTAAASRRVSGRG